MRYVLFEANAARVPLATELAHLARYLEIESLRHTHPRYATFEVLGDPAGRTVPPTLFMPFVENAFKHAARGDGPERIRVRCEVDRDAVTFRCVNVCRPEDATAARPGGLGHALARRRLELLYPGRHTLQLQRGDADYTAVLTIRSPGDARDDSLPDR
jgi:LytS/YehU family sensor histidine kinase